MFTCMMLIETANCLRRSHEGFGLVGFIGVPLKEVWCAEIMARILLLGTQP